MKASLLIVIFSCRLFGAFGHVIDAQVTSSNSVSATTSAVNATGANLFVAVVTTPSGSPLPVVTDSLSNTCWTVVDESDASGTSRWTFNCFAATTSSSISFVVTGNFPNIVVMAFSGASGASIDVIGTADTFNAATWPMSTFTPGASNTLLIASAGTPTVLMSSIDTSFTLVAGGSVNGTAVAGAWRIESGLTAVAPTWTPASFIGGSAAITSYKAGSATPKTKRRVLSGGE